MKRQAHNHPPFRPTCAEHPVGACLVVIDPEDREQVERLSMALAELDHRRYAISLSEGVRASLADDMQTALRSLNDPPKPAEPTGLGAVVEDESGDRYVRTDGDEYPWFSQRTGAWTRWGSVSAVEVLSKGVS